MPGAAVLTARAALRAGSGLVTIAVPDDIAVAFPSAVPEATLFLLPPSTESDPSRFRERLEEALAENWDAIGIGPGLGVDPAKQALVEAIGEWRGPQCFDADALNNVAKGIVVDRRADRVWTPHPGEFRRLTARLPVTRSERLDCARAFVRERGGVLSLKGRGTIVHGEASYFVNTTGNPGMATGGAGDVLTGIVTSFLGQGFAAYEAAVLGTYLHGLAGDLAARARGEASLVASDIIEHLCDAFGTLATRQEISGSGRRA